MSKNPEMGMRPKPGPLTRPYNGEPKPGTKPPGGTKPNYSQEQERLQHRRAQRQSLMNQQTGGKPLKPVARGRVGGSVGSSNNRSTRTSALQNMLSMLNKSKTK